MEKQLRAIIDSTSLSDDVKVQQITDLVLPKPKQAWSKDGKYTWFEDAGGAFENYDQIWYASSKNGALAIKFTTPVQIDNETYFVTVEWENRRDVQPTKVQINKPYNTMLMSILTRSDGGSTIEATERVQVQLPVIKRPDPKGTDPETGLIEIIDNCNRRVYHVDTRGRIQGLYYSYYNSGNIKYTTTFVDDKVAGLSVTWYDQNTDGHDKEWECYWLQHTNTSSPLIRYNRDGSEYEFSVYEDAKLCFSQEKGTWTGPKPEPRKFEKTVREEEN